MSSLDWLLALVVLTGALAPTDPVALERVEARRLRNGWGLVATTPPGTVRIAVEDCRLLGRRGVMAVSGIGWRKVTVVDCQAAADRARQPMAALGLVADVDDVALGHRWALVLLWQ